LKSSPVDKRREILLIDAENDQRLQSVIQSVINNLSTRTRRQQIRQIATAVSNLMGGAIEESKLSEFGYKFRTTEVKLRLESNVIPISQISAGTFYHRALLFKALCDRVGLSPCTLVRGDYNRAWNVVDLRKQTLQTSAAVAPRPTTSSTASSAAAKRPTTSARGLPPSREPTVAVTSQGSSGSAGLAGAGTVNSVQQLANAANPAFPPNWEPAPEADVNLPEEPVIVDLMFEPGRILPLSSPEAIAYQRG
jgi:hypothetical protein